MFKELQHSPPSKHINLNQEVFRNVWREREKELESELANRLVFKVKAFAKFSLADDKAFFVFGLRYSSEKIYTVALMI